MTLTLEGGKTFTVLAPNVSSKNRYVRSVKLNGRRLSRRYLTREDIVDGGTLEFEMTSNPRRKSIPSPADLPYSLSRDL